MIKAFQDYFPGNSCFGCGPHNTRGLHIKSYWRDETKKESICIWHPKKYHAASTPDIVHGGNIASLIDCHSIWTAAAWAYHLENRAFASEPIIWFVTARLDVRLLRPTPLKTEATVIVNTEEIKIYGKKTILRAKLFADGLLCTVGKVTAVKIDYDTETIAKLSHRPE